MPMLGPDVKLFLAVMPDGLLYPLLGRPGAVCFQKVSTAMHHSSVDCILFALWAASRCIAWLCQTGEEGEKSCLLASIVCTRAFLFCLLWCFNVYLHL